MSKEKRYSDTVIISEIASISKFRSRWHKLSRLEKEFMLKSLDGNINSKLFMKIYKQLLRARRNEIS